TLPQPSFIHFTASWNRFWQARLESNCCFHHQLVAIIPLAAVLSFATKEISMKLGKTLSRLLNGIFRNEMVLIVTVAALQRNEIEFAQGFILDSILSNLLLVMEMCFLLGSIIHRGESGNGREQRIPSATARITWSLMTLSSASLVIPAALDAVLDQSGSDEKAKASSHSNVVLPLPRFQNPTRMTGRGVQEPTLEPITAVAVLVVTAVLVTRYTDCLVGGINGLATTSGISRGFIGLILIPFVANVAGHVTTVTFAFRDKMEHAMSVAFGSSIQTALLVTPFLVIVGWIIDAEMTLHFKTFQTVAFAVSVLVVTYTIKDGKSKYLEGAMLMGLYIIVALAFHVTLSGIMDTSK
ncbi:unnamed protein product, partial [Fusarium fujikuroi]